MAAGGAAITAFYMFRLWYLTFAGKPRDHHIYEHAHESPRIMYMPLVVLRVSPVFVGGSLRGLSVQNLLEQARPAGTLVASTGKLLPDLRYPSEHDIHLEENHDVHMKAEGIAFITAMAGLLLATILYGWRWLDAAEVAQQFRPLYLFLLNKWYFDELYQAIFVAPVMFIARRVSQCDKELLDRFLDGLASLDAKIVAGRRHGRSLPGRRHRELDGAPHVWFGIESAHGRNGPVAAVRGVYRGRHGGSGRAGQLLVF